MTKTGARSDPLLAEIAELVRSRMGLHFPPERQDDLDRGIAAAARELGVESPEDFLRQLACEPFTQAQIELLAGNLTVGETYFFREPASFEALEAHLLAELIEARRASERRLRLWSAGCCTGEEAYSLAILLCRLIPDIDDWNVTILATDINPRFLRKGSEGVYGEWSFRGAPEWVRRSYFEPVAPTKLKVAAGIRKLVTFEYLNLAEDPYPSLLNNTNAMDVILCRNVLMYFAPERIREVIGAFHRSLVRGGCLMLGASETSFAHLARFQPREAQGAFMFRKLEWDSTPLAARNDEIDFRETGAPQPLPPRASVQPGDPRHDRAGDPFVRARELLDRGLLGQAEESASELVVRDPVRPEGMVLLARVLANEGRLAEALPWCEKAIAIEKLNPGHRYLYAAILLESGDVEGAASALRGVLYLDPLFVLAHFALGNLARLGGRRAAASRHFRSALSLLRDLPASDPLPGSEGITAGRLEEIIRSTVEGEALVP